MSMLVVMGSGETAPTMVKVHREVLARSTGGLPSTGPGSWPGTAVLLDTPFGFQMNADDLVARTRGYFRDSVGVDVEVARWRRADAPLVEQEQALALLGRATWAFAGPGSPTYALRQWRGTPVPDALLDVAHRGGTLVFGSAAACTLGTHTIPVYEVYKVGTEPFWEPGLDLLGQLTDVHAVVIPHYDNAEGGGHDTRFCYLGEQRLSLLESKLPDEIGVLGVDEHTALLLDLDTRQATVTGNGTVTVRRRGTSQVFRTGTEISFSTLRALLRGEAAPSGEDADLAGTETGTATTGGTGTRSRAGTGATTGAGATPGAGAEARDGTSSLGGPGSSTATAASPADTATPGVPLGTGSAGTPPSLRTDADAARSAFEQGLADADVDACITAILDLESAIVAWSADTLQSDDTDYARRVLRALVVRLGDLARVGARDPRDVAAPYVDLLLDVRARARSTKDFATSDLIRDGLTGVGVEVRDTASGVEWTLA